MLSCRSYYLTVAAVAASLFMLLSSNAHAHKVNVFAYAEGGKVHTESYFADGTRAAGCKVTVEDMAGKQLLEGMTDEEGMFSFDIPAAEDLKVVLHASMGHKNDYVISADELKAAMPNTAAKAEPERKREAPAAGKQTVKKVAAAEPAAQKASRVSEAAQPASLDKEELRAVVDEAVEARLKPLYKMLADMREEAGKPALTDVLGGIGYIMGIMGIILYFKSRKT